MRVSVLIVLAMLFVTFDGIATGQQSSSKPEGAAPCQPQAATATVPFDTCKYLPVWGGRAAPGIRPPRGRTIVNPEYTDAARKAKINGSVVVAVAINAEGTVDNVKLVRGLGYGLDQKAMQAVRDSKFEPASGDGKPIPAQVNMETTFELY